MADIPHPWDAYGHLQVVLSRAHRVSDQTWGTEAALDALLRSLQDNQPVTSDDLTRTAASERRRENATGRTCASSISRVSRWAPIPTTH